MSLYIEEQGNPDGLPLVLLHGWGLSSDVWQGWLPSLEDNHRLLRVDLPGLGRSAFDPERPYSLDAVAEQLITQLLPRLHRPAIWLGWSLGGLVAACVAKKITDTAPANIAGLITIATTPCFVQHAGWPEAMDRDLFDSFQLSLQSDPLKTLNRFVMLQGQGDWHARSLTRELKPIAADCLDQASHLAESLALLAGDYRPLFASLNLPRLHVFASNDALVPVAVCEQPLLAQHSQCLNEAGHVPFLTAEETLTPIIRSWCAGVEHA